MESNLHTFIYGFSFKVKRQLIGNLVSNPGSCSNKSKGENLQEGRNCGFEAGDTFSVAQSK